MRKNKEKVPTVGGENRSSETRLPPGGSCRGATEGEGECIRVVLLVRTTATPSTASGPPSRYGSGTLEGKQRTVLFSNTLAPLRYLLRGACGITLSPDVVGSSPRGRAYSIFRSNSPQGGGDDASAFHTKRLSL